MSDGRRRIFPADRADRSGRQIRRDYGKKGLVLAVPAGVNRENIICQQDFGADGHIVFAVQHLYAAGDGRQLLVERIFHIIIISA